MSKRKILAVGAHPDDVELGCGGSLVKHLELGDEVYVLVMTNGENGKHTSDNQEECFDSLIRIGIKRQNIFFGGFQDGKLKDDRDTVGFIERFIVKLGIDRVYTHYVNDRHQDHRNCSLAVSAGARKVPEIMLYQGPSTNVPFEPHYIVELSDNEINKKVEALNSYKSQIKKGIVNTEWIKALAMFNGLPNGAKYAEAFAINHVFKRKSEV
jgi:LmbE family N-acetylglucosaminyl deacetylase